MSEFFGLFEVTIKNKGDGADFEVNFIVNYLKVDVHTQDLWSDGIITGTPGFLGTVEIGKTITMRVGRANDP